MFRCYTRYCPPWRVRRGGRSATQIIHPSIHPSNPDLQLGLQHACFSALSASSCYTIAIKLLHPSNSCYTRATIATPKQSHDSACRSVRLTLQHSNRRSHNPPPGMPARTAPPPPAGDQLYHPYRTITTSTTMRTPPAALRALSEPCADLAWMLLRSQLFANEPRPSAATSRTPC